MSVVFPVRAALPERVSAPELVASPSANAPVNKSALVSVRAVTESEERRPPVKVSAPVPRAALSPTWMAPALRVQHPHGERRR